MKILVLTHNAKIPFSNLMYFTGWVAGTWWPEYVKSPAQAKVVSDSVAEDALSILRGQGFKARTATPQPTV